MAQTKKGGIKVSYASYKKHFENLKSHGFIAPGQQLLSLDAYSREKARFEKNIGGSVKGSQLADEQTNFKYSEAKEQIADLLRFSKDKKFDIKQSWSVEVAIGFEYDYRRKVPIATTYKTFEIDFTNKTTKQMTEELRKLPRNGLVALLIEMGYSREDALEFIGY